MPAAPAGTWIGEASADDARLLVAAIDRADRHGLDPERLLPPADRAVIRAALEPSTPRADRQAAERLLTRAYLRWARALETPALAPIDVVVPEALPPSSDPRALLRRAARTDDLAAHLEALERRHPFHDALRAALAAERAGRARAARERLLIANLERTRLLPVTGRHLVVDTASQMLWMFDGRTLQGRMKVIVGTPDNPTPTMASLVEAAIARPYWNVPEDLAQTRIAPRVVRNGIRQLEREHMKLLSGWTEDAVVIPPDSVDWKAAAARRLSVRLRQDPGPWNMMGRMKILIRNDLGIYLHDTPDRALFRRKGRTLSAGCIRVEDWRRLADWLFEGSPPPEDGPAEQVHPLPRPVPIYVLHLTVDPLAPDRRVADAYGRDRGPASATASVR